MIIIERPLETKKIADVSKWVLVYGRRKTGKTFLVENCVKYDEYFFVKRDKSIVSKRDGRTIDYDAFKAIVERALAEGRTVVVDEFHRLGDDFFDFLHYVKKQGKMILLSSTLFLSKKLFSSKSPLLGLFAEARIGLMKLGDCLKALKGYGFDKKDFLELAIMLREPITTDYFNEKKAPRKLLAEIIGSLTKTIPAMMGEIFLEEERETSIRYEGILRAVASGRVVSSEITNYLFSRKIIKKDDPSSIQQYLDNLVSFGILRKIRVFDKKRFVYKHCSHLARIFYYADEKYNISEREPTEGELERIIDELMPKIVEDNVREFLAEKNGLEESVVEAKDYGIDACLLKFKKPEIVVEVKWSNKISRDDIEKAEKNLEKIDAGKKFLFVPDKKSIKTKLQVIDVTDLM